MFGFVEGGFEALTRNQEDQQRDRHDDDRDVIGLAEDRDEVRYEVERRDEVSDKPDQHDRRPAPDSPVAEEGAAETDARRSWKSEEATAALGEAQGQVGPSRRETENSEDRDCPAIPRHGAIVDRRSRCWGQVGCDRAQSAATIEQLLGGPNS